MKKTALFLLLFIGFSINMNAQKFRGIDKSPMDLVALKETKKSPSIIKIYYSRPQKKGREIFGNILPYGKMWRLGANEATEIIVSKDIIFGGSKLKEGHYSMYAIPNKKEWTVIINKKTDTWGNYEYDNSLDILRISVPVKKTDTELEAFSMKFKKISKDKKTTLFLAWDTTLVSIPIEL